MRGGNLLVRNGLIVTSEAMFKADVKVVDGKIVSIGEGLSNEGVDEVIDAKGMLVLPGVVDEHVHMREPGLEFKDDFTHGTKAAALGGVTTVIEQPNTLPPVEDSKTLLAKAKLLEGKAFVDFALYGVLHDSNVHNFEDMISSGAVGFKVFLGPTTGNIPPPSTGSLYHILSLSAKHNVTIAFHAEDNDLVNYFTNKVRSEGRVDAKAHEDARPPICEELAVIKLATITRRTGGHAHILHLSSKEAVEVIKEGKVRGVKLTGETCPHYLLLSNEDYVKYGTLMKVNPPIRGLTHQQALWEGIKEGVIETIGSDHAPHTVEEKKKSVWEASSGFIGVQTLLPLTLDAALKGKLQLTLLPKLLSENPAKLFKLWPRKGVINVGSDGDLVIVDPNEEFTITQEWLISKNPVTPFIGWKVRGRIKHTILRGVPIVRDGVLQNVSQGSWLKAVF